MTEHTTPTEPGDYRNVDGVVVRIDENGAPFRVLDILGATHLFAILDLGFVVAELGPFELIVTEPETPPTPPTKPATKAASKAPKAPVDEKAAA